MPDIVLAPELVFLLFLPPLLYIAAFDTAIRDIRAMLRPIISLAVGLVLATTVAVAAVTVIGEDLKLHHTSLSVSRCSQPRGAGAGV